MDCYQESAGAVSYCKIDKAQERAIAQIEACLCPSCFFRKGAVLLSFWHLAQIHKAHNICRGDLRADAVLLPTLQGALKAKEERAVMVYQVCTGVLQYVWSDERLSDLQQDGLIPVV